MKIHIVWYDNICYSKAHRLWRHRFARPTGTDDPCQLVLGFPCRRSLWECQVALCSVAASESGDSTTAQHGAARLRRVRAEKLLAPTLLLPPSVSAVSESGPGLVKAVRTAVVTRASTYIHALEMSLPPRLEPVQTAAEKFGRTHFFQQTVAARPSMVSVDITGPQFRIEEPRNRTTDPLMPSYLYDGAHSEQVATRRPHYGSQFTRTVEENYNLRTDDILTEKIFNREYPKALIQTRPANRIDDITGAQADTRCAAPKLWKIKDPSLVGEKLTNRVMDIEGAIAGTGGQGPPLYRTRKQAAAVSAAAYATQRAVTAPKLSTATAADIAAVRADGAVARPITAVARARSGVEEARGGAGGAAQLKVEAPRMSHERVMA